MNAANTYLEKLNRMERKLTFTINRRNNNWKSMIDLILIAGPENSSQKNVT